MLLFISAIVDSDADLDNEQSLQINPEVTYNNSEPYPYGFDPVSTMYVVNYSKSVCNLI